LVGSVCPEREPAIATNLRTALAVSCLAALALAAPADAAFPGANGKLAFVHYASGATGQIYTMNPDGTGRTPLTSGPAYNFEPAWSPDGKKIAFSTTRDDLNPGSCGAGCNSEIYVMDSDGANQTRLTNDASADGFPQWSPDGTKIVFDIYSMNADGTGVVRLTTSSFRDADPSWSPDGAKIAFTAQVTLLRLMNPDGTNQTTVTSDSDLEKYAPDWSPDATTIAYQQHSCCDPNDNTQEVHTVHRDGTGDLFLGFNSTGPAWSPDGSRIAIGDQLCQYIATTYFCSGKDIITMNPDGSGRLNLTNNSGDTASSQPSWQPLPRTYARPRGASPLRASLVPAYRQCNAPNDSHGSPLAFGSCAPPAQSSSYLTVGTPDANGEGAKATASLLMRAFSCPACVGPGPNADVRLDVSVSDVRVKADLSDYAGELRADASLRITDKDNTPNPGGPGPGTGSDTRFPFTVPCAATSDATVGSTCSVSTSANAVVPNSVVAGQRAIWQLGAVQVYDGGASGVAGAPDATLFMDQGIFVP
jgi:hypothetical protein